MPWPHPERARAFLIGFALAGLTVVGVRVSGQTDRDQLQAPQPPLGATFRPRVAKLLKVGMATDRESLSVPCCQGQLVVQALGKALGVESELLIEPRAEIASAARYRVQVAALKDQGQAEQLARWLGERLGQPAEATFDASTDLYRVRAGRWESRAEAESADRELRADGLEPWIVSERGELRSVGFRVSHAGGAIAMEGRWLSIRRSRGDGLRIDAGRYRGRILLFLSDRGTMNVINELSLEDYLRGVVPMEMGPIVYSSLEALKAQSVAARTYAMRNLGEFDDEGYDICATPRCQVYGGMEAEHPLSDRAIRETSGEVLIYGGDIVDALYSASCGGHTEDVEVVFPFKSYPYLKGVPCPEGGVDPLAGNLDRGTPLVVGLMRGLLGAAEQALGAAGAEARFRRLATLAGLPASRGGLESLDRRDVRRFIGSLFDLVLDARLFTSGTETSLLLDNPPAEWSADDLRLATYLDRTGLLAAPFEGALGDQELDEVLFQLSIYLGVVEVREAGYLSRAESSVQVKSELGTESLALSPSLATFHGGEHIQRSAPLVLRPGDAVTLYLHDGQLIALVQQVDGEVRAGTPGAKVKTWRRSHTDSHLRQMVAGRYPEIDFETFEVVERGISGRAGKIRLIGRNGETLDVEGLAVRWTLDLPDTLFTARRIEPVGKEAGWLFTGRGHGHGVGMCQLGAFGMGLRGRTYREILAHYYTDVEITELELVDGQRIEGVGQ